MLMDQSSPANKQKAYELIKKIRESPKPETFDVPRYVPDIDYKCVQPFQPPHFNKWQELTKADTISDFLETNGALFESPLTIGIPLQKLKDQAEKGDCLTFPKMPCHSQSVERMVKLVTKDSSKVRSYKRRHQEIFKKNRTIKPLNLAYSPPSSKVTRRGVHLRTLRISAIHSTSCQTVSHC